MLAELNTEAAAKLETHNQILFGWFIDYLRTLGQAHQLLVWGDREIYMGTYDYFRSGGKINTIDPEERDICFYVSKPQASLPDISVLNQEYRGNSIQDLIGFEKTTKEIGLWIKTNTQPRLPLSIDLEVRAEVDQAETIDEMWSAPDYRIKGSVAINIILESMRGIVNTATPKLS